MEKIDLKKVYKEYYKARVKPEIVNLGKAKYIAIDGKGDPKGDEFQHKVRALYKVAYGIKKVCKEEGHDFVVPKLEGIWWYEEDKPFFDVPRSHWLWELLIRMPEYVKKDILSRVKDKLVDEEVLVRDVFLKEMEEGMCVQILHKGAYSDEEVSVKNYMILWIKRTFK